MNSNSIYQILSSKPHNPHYLKRYFNFIMAIRENASLIQGESVEAHHICPKASDLFPEYKNFSKHPWNKVALTVRQHIIAHVMLWKAYGGSQTFAIDYFLNRYNNDNANMPYNRKVPTSLTIRYAAKAREAAKKEREGFGSWRNKDGEIFFLHKDDPRIIAEGLKGIRAGNVTPQMVKDKMSATKLLSRMVEMTFLDLDRDVALFSEDYDNHLAQGWRPRINKGTRKHRICEEDKEYRRLLTSQKVSEKLKGRADYMLPSGEYYGKLEKDDPAIEEFGLKIYTSEAKRNSALKSSKLAQEKLTGAKVYNNGTINIKSKEHPGEGWVEGQLVDQSAIDARAEGLRKVRAGKKVWNDGKNNFYFDEGVIPEDSNMKPGMAPQKQRKKPNRNFSVWNDGVRGYRVYDGDSPEPNWVPGMAPRK